LKNGLYFSAHAAGDMLILGKVSAPEVPGCDAVVHLFAVPATDAGLCVDVQVFEAFPNASLCRGCRSYCSNRPGASQWLAALIAEDEFSVYVLLTAEAALVHESMMMPTE
jgi:hypothetical protein